MNRLVCFSECLKDLLLEYEISIKEFSERTHIKQSRIYDFLNQSHAPSLENAIKIATFFGCSLDYLFGFSSDYSACDFNIKDSVHNRLKIAIDQSKFSRYQLHKAMNVSQPQLSRWYHGTQQPTLVSLIALADRLNCSLDFLAGRD